MFIALPPTPLQPDQQADAHCRKEADQVAQ
jgi:hypothetical protein